MGSSGHQTLGRRAFCAAAAAASLGLQRTQPALAQESWPNKPVKLIVPFAPGGATDVVTRVIADKLSQMWGQPVLVDNKGGGNGIIAAEAVKNAKPDGYTLLATSSMTHAGNPVLYDKLPYDARRDLMGISLSAVSKYVLVTSPSGFRNLKDLFAAARAKPGSMNFSSAGIGSGTHFAGELLKSMAKIDVVHIPLKGIPEAMAAAVCMMWGYPAADPIISIVLAGVVAWGAWAVTREASAVLLQLPPPGFDVNALMADLRALRGVRGVHDVHVWTLDGREPIVTAHLVSDGEVDHDTLVASARTLAHDKHDVDHGTFQVESDGSDCGLGACGVH